MKLAILVTSILMLASYARANEETSHMEIAKDGASQYVVVTPDKPSLTETFAAQELVKYIEQISGVRLSTRKGGRLPKYALVVCDERTELGEWARLAGQPAVTEDGVRHSREQISHLPGRRTGSAPRCTRRMTFWDVSGACGWPQIWIATRDRASVVTRKTELSVELPSLVIEKPAFKFPQVGRGRRAYPQLGQPGSLIDWMAKTRPERPRRAERTCFTMHRTKWDNWRDRLIPELRKAGHDS